MKNQYSSRNILIKDYEYCPAPALRKLGFWDVRYNHGIEEYGKDVTYRYKDNFEKIKLGAAQVKYGDISGAANSDIDKIFSQIADAFNMPFSHLNENGQLYINQFLIICSGKYSKNAKEKIKEKFSPKDREKYDVQDKVFDESKEKIILKNEKYEILHILQRFSS